MANQTSEEVLDTWGELGEAAWGRVLRFSQAYFRDGMARAEEVLHATAASMLEDFDRIVIVDIGCGSGETLVEALRWAEAMGWKARIRAVGVDVNEQIVPPGQEGLAFVKSDCTAACFGGELRKHMQAGEGVLATCLGNTLGIFQHEERVRILSSLAGISTCVMVVVARASAFAHAVQHYYPLVARDLGIEGGWRTEGTTLVANNYYSHWTSAEEARLLFQAAGMQLRQLDETERILVGVGKSHPPSDCQA